MILLKRKCYQYLKFSLEIEDLKKVSEKGVSDILVSLEKNYTITDIVINIEATDEQLDIVDKIMDRNIDFSKFDEKKVRDGNLDYIIDKLKVNHPKLKEIKLTKKVEKDQATKLFSALEKNTKVFNLSLEKNELTDDSIDVFGTALLYNKIIET